MIGDRIAQIARDHIGEVADWFAPFPCAGLITLVGFDCGLLSANDLARHRAASRITEVFNILHPKLRKIKWSEAKPGDICAGGINDRITQSGIIVSIEPRAIVHVTERVIEELLPAHLNATLIGIFRFKGTEDGI